MTRVTKLTEFVDRIIDEGFCDPSPQVGRTCLDDAGGSKDKVTKTNSRGSQDDERHNADQPKEPRASVRRLGRGAVSIDFF